MTGNGQAPGHPGIEPRWTSSSKHGVGTAVGPRSRVWFTFSHGILNEVYYPRVDQANIRDLGLLVTDGSSFFSEEKRHTTSEVALIGPGIPGYHITNTCVDRRYRIRKTILTDPRRPVVLQEIQFEALEGTLADYRVYVLLAPHIGNQGYGNTGWVGDYKGVPMLFAQRSDCSLALACSSNFAATSCGFVGVSDGWQQIHQHKHLVDCYPRADDGNIALTGEIDIAKCDGRFVLTLAFGSSPTEAGEAARGGLLRHFDNVRNEFVEEWKQFHSQSRRVKGADAETTSAYHLGIAMLQTHEDKDHAGALIASLSIPWGSSKGDHDMGGYHVAWPRDLAESAGALLAAGHTDIARHALHFLMITQDADGHWPQNMWLDGTAYWGGTQLDETGFPILLADQLRRRKGLDALDPWPMVCLAAAYLVRHGPVTPEDRWEEDGGYSPSTIAVEVAALLAAADFAEAAGAARAAQYLRDTADAWNDGVEGWMYVTETELAERNGVEGYYVRIAPPDLTDGRPRDAHVVTIKNQPADKSRVVYTALVSPDALALVRFGLRRADDPRIVNTVRVIDRELLTETDSGPVWHRYNNDGYGEHANGAPFDGTGIGRGWPLLAGERAHYELAAGHADEAKRLAKIMLAQASPGGLIPEQVWDAADIPARELVNGQPSGSAMPLAWAHAEYVKLVRSIHDKRVFDMPPQPRRRYIQSTHHAAFASWRFNYKIRSIPAGRTLRIETYAAAMVHWSSDDWATVHDAETVDTTLGVWYVDLPVADVAAGGSVKFTFYWTEAGRWEGEDFVVGVG